MLVFYLLFFSVMVSARIESYDHLLTLPYQASSCQLYASSQFLATHCPQNFTIYNHTLDQVYSTPLGVTQFSKSASGGVSFITQGALHYITKSASTQSGVLGEYNHYVTDELTLSQNAQKTYLRVYRQNIEADRLASVIMPSGRKFEYAVRVLSKNSVELVMCTAESPVQCRLYYSPNEGEMSQKKQFELQEPTCANLLKLTETHLAVQCGTSVWFYDSENYALVKQSSGKQLIGSLHDTFYFAGYRTLQSMQWNTIDAVSLSGENWFEVTSRFWYDRHMHMPSMHYNSIHIHAQNFQNDLVSADFEGNSVYILAQNQNGLQIMKTNICTGVQQKCFELEEGTYLDSRAYLSGLDYILDCDSQQLMGWSRVEQNLQCKLGKTLPKQTSILTVEIVQTKMCNVTEYFSAQNSSCMPCMKDCEYCDIATECLQCFSPFIVTENGQCGCQRGQYLNGNGCSACSSDCLRCSDGKSCQECATGFSVNRGRCDRIQCRDGEYLDGSHCVQCDGQVCPVKAGTALKIVAGIIVPLVLLIMIVGGYFFIKRRREVPQPPPRSEKHEETRRSTDLKIRTIQTTRRNNTQSLEVMSTSRGLVKNTWSGQEHQISVIREDRTLETESDRDDFIFRELQFNSHFKNTVRESDSQFAVPVVREPGQAFKIDTDAITEEDCEIYSQNRTVSPDRIRRQTVGGIMNKCYDKQSSISSSSEEVKQDVTQSHNNSEEQENHMQEPSQ